MALSDKWTLTQIVQAAEKELMDSANKYWTQAELESLAEAWQDTVNGELELVWGAVLSTETSSIIDSGTVADDIARIDAVYFNNTRLTPRNVNEMNALEPGWRETDAGSPGVIVPLDSTRFQLWPAPAQGGYVYWEYPRLLEFASSTSTMDLPAWCRYSSIAYICYRAYLRPGVNHNLQRAYRWKRKFEKSLTDIDSIRHQYFPDRAPRLRIGGQYDYDILLARRRAGETAVPPVTTSFHYDEIPTGTVNGVNDTFTLTFAPDPTASLKLWVDGLKMTATTHYTLSSTTITFVTAFIPQTDQKIFATYRYTI